jgi:hypothetical protein
MTDRMEQPGQDSQDRRLSKTCHWGVVGILATLRDIPQQVLETVENKIYLLEVCRRNLIMCPRLLNTLKAVDIGKSR